MSIPNPSLLCLVLLLSVVNNFQLINSFSFNYLVLIIVCIPFDQCYTTLWALFYIDKVFEIEVLAFAEVTVTIYLGFFSGSILK
jgi:hypothetical protein